MYCFSNFEISNDKYNLGTERARHILYGIRRTSNHEQNISYQHSLKLTPVDSMTRTTKWWQEYTQMAKFMGPAWGPPGSCRPQMGPMLVQ